MQKEEVISRIRETGLVAVVRAENSDQAKRITEACIEGGVVAVEITFTVPGAQDVLSELARTYTNDEIILGAGTVLDPETSRIAILNGAQYVVAPHLDPETLKTCNRYRIPCMPGATTVKDVITAMELGADIIKVFPGELYGPKIIKAIKGPIPYANLMPTGGVTVDNVHEWIKAGSVAVGAGSSLISGAKTGDYKQITKTAERFIEQIKLARSNN